MAGASVGCTYEIVQLSEKLIIEVNTALPNYLGKFYSRHFAQVMFDLELATQYQLVISAQTLGSDVSLCWCFRCA